MTKSRDLTIFERKYDNKAEIWAQEDRINTNIAEKIFRNIKDYSFLHSSQVLEWPLVKAMELNLSGLCDYLDSRIVPSKHRPNDIQCDLLNKEMKLIQYENEKMNVTKYNSCSS